MATNRILVVEDDPSIRRGILDALAFDGFQTLEADNGKRGLELALKCDYDLMLLDLVLPEVDGLDILGQLRKHRPTQPVIILTARGAEKDRVQGLRLGADDYVVKPFSVKELLARIDAVLRRSPERAAEIEEVSFSGGKADLRRCEVRFENGDVVALSEREQEILRYLAGNAGRAISRNELLTRVWRISTRGVETRTIDMHIARLREKLRDSKQNPAIVVTVRGKGYMFGNSNGDSSSDGR